MRRFTNTQMLTACLGILLMSHWMFLTGCGGTEEDWQVEEEGKAEFKFKKGSDEECGWDIECGKDDDGEDLICRPYAENHLYRVATFRCQTRGKFRDLCGEQDDCEPKYYCLNLKPNEDFDGEEVGYCYDSDDFIDEVREDLDLDDDPKPGVE